MLHSLKHHRSLQQKDAIDEKNGRFDCSRSWLSQSMNTPSTYPPVHLWWPSASDLGPYNSVADRHCIMQWRVRNNRLVFKEFDPCNSLRGPPRNSGVMNVFRRWLPNKAKQPRIISKISFFLFFFFISILCSLAKSQGTHFREGNCNQPKAFK